MSSPELVLITGATGHIGFRTLAQVLEQGFHARVTSRRLASAETLKDLPSILPYASNLEAVEVPDLTAAGAFDDALQGVTYILHIASPIPDVMIVSSGSHYDAQKDFVQPAVESTLEILRAAARSPSVRRVVITSTIGLLRVKNGSDDVDSPPSADEAATSHWQAYRRGKILAYRAANEWLEAHKPNFDVVWILPGYVMGRNEPVRSTKGLLDRNSSNSTMLSYALGIDTPGDEPRSLDLVLVDDVASVHVAALTAKGVVNGERFIAAPPKAVGAYADMDVYVRKWFPAAVETGLLPLGGKVIGIQANLDSRKTIQKLGVSFAGLEEMVKSSIGQYVELARAEGLI
jgi:nucleoside-diphosphate-sugar epimerase